MRQLRDDAIFLAPGNAIRSLDPNRPSATFDILAFARTVLGKGTPELTAVIAWARIMAGGGDRDASIAQWCREMGWQPRTFHRRRIRACEILAAAKNYADGRSG